MPKTPVPLMLASGLLTLYDRLEKERFSYREGETITMNKQTIFFDLDDTLIHCNKYFHAVIDRFADWIVSWFEGFPVSKEQVKEIQYEIDVSAVAELGFAADHFPRSLVRTYEHFCAAHGCKPSENKREQLVELGKSVYLNPDIEPYPNMNETLGELSDQGHDLYLYTGGDEEIQYRKIQKMGLETFFGDRIFIRQHKTTETLESILNKGKFNRSRTWMIGNSIRTDVVPALETGINAIHIPAIMEWKYNIVDIPVKPQRSFLRLNSLIEVPPALQSPDRSGEKAN
jgi:putative hydrolase of the HAD superfamily